MIKRYLILTCFVFSACLAQSQTTGQDSIPPLIDNDIPIDTSINYDDFLSEFDLFMDSILAPRSYFLANLSVARSYFNYITNYRVDVVKKNVLSPGIGYYNKNGMGITATGNMVSDKQQFNLYQFSVSPSFDYLKNRKLAAGISYMRYFTKDSLPFYLSPLENEVYGYFLWRRSWLQPGITASYGWGSRTEYKKREIIYRKLIVAAIRNGTIGSGVIDTLSILIANRRSIVDFTLTGSLRHDFYWLDVFSGKDHIRLSPMLSLNAGTQKFGSNQTTGTYTGVTRASTVYNLRNKNISLVQKFKVLSLSLYLRSEYSIGKFFVQPQVILDYYFPSPDDNMSTLFSLNTGFIF